MRYSVLIFVFLVLFLYRLPGNAQSLETVIQKGHELAVLAVAVSPDTNYVATASKDKSAKLWEVSSGREVRSFLEHEASVTCVAFSEDGKTLISGSNDKQVKLWDVETGKEKLSIQTEDYITDVAIDPLGRFFVFSGYNTTGYGDSAVICDFKSAKIIKKISVSPDKGLGSGVSISISHRGNLIAFGEDNRVASLYETVTWEKIHVFQIEEGFCGGCGTTVQFSHDDNFLYRASKNSALEKFDLKTFKSIKIYEEKSDEIIALTVSFDNRFIAASTEKEIKVWDESTGTLIKSLQAEEQKDFSRISFTRNGERLLIASADNTAFIWNIKSQKNENVFTGFLNQRDRGGLSYDPNFYWQSSIAKYVRFKNSLLISRDGKTLIKGKFGKKIKRWDIATGKTIMEYVGHNKAVLCYDLSKDGKRLLSGGGDGKIILWDLESGDSLMVIKSYREPIFDIHFNADETKAISSSWDATFKIHDLQTGKLLTLLDFQNTSAYSLIPHANDLYVFTARLDNSVQMWELDTKSVVRNFVGHTGIVSSIQLSKNSQQLLTAGWDGSIRLWDVTSGLMNRKFNGHRGAVHTAIFDTPEKFIYSAGADRIIRMWDVTTGNITKTFEGHQAEITSLLLHPDGKMLISHSVDGVTKFWDLNTGKEFFEHIHLGEHDWLVKNPEGFFSGTDQARQYIHFVKGTKTYAVDQFFQEYFRPELLPKIFQNRGGVKEQKGIQGKLQSSPPAEIRVAIVPASDTEADVYVKMTNVGGGVKDLQILHNGKSVSISKGQITFPKSQNESTTYKHRIALIGGLNTFTARALNNENVESDPQSAEIFSESVAKSSVCYILSIGINEYQNGKLNLNYAKSDAESFANALEANNEVLFKNIKLLTLYDKDATKEKILSTLNDLAAMIHPEDVFIFYYAGHGSMVENKFYFIPTEAARLYDQSSLQKEAIEASVLQEKLKGIKALKQLIIMDACQSGGSVELLVTRGAAEEKAIAQLSRSAGIHVMASAGSEQFATEFASLGHGLFTYVLVKALQGEADGAPKDGKVTIYELKSYIDDQVPEMTRTLKGKPQYPYTFSRGQDFPVVWHD